MPTSNLQQYTASVMYTIFGRTSVVENSRPPWLVTNLDERLELDIYIPSLGIAVEVQGKQHFEYTPYFHATVGEFESQQRRDIDKRTLCKAYGVELHEVATEEEADALVFKIKGARFYLIERNNHMRKAFENSLRTIEANKARVIELMQERDYHRIKGHAQSVQVLNQKIAGIQDQIDTAIIVRARKAAALSAYFDKRIWPSIRGNRQGK